MTPAVLSESGSDDPPIELGHQAVTLGGRNKSHGWNQLPVLVLHAQKHFIVLTCLPVIYQWQYFLRVQYQPLFFQRLLYASDPPHLAMTLRNFHVLRGIDLYSIASFVLGKIASCIRHA